MTAMINARITTFRGPPTHCFLAMGWPPDRCRLAMTSRMPSGAAYTGLTVLDLPVRSWGGQLRSQQTNAMRKGFFRQQTTKLVFGVADHCVISTEPSY